MGRPKIWTKNFLYLCGSNFLIGLMFYMLATVFPLYVQSGMNGNQQQMGLVITVYVIGSVLARIFSGLWVDRFGNKKISIIGFAIFFIATVSYFGVINGILLFLVVRFIHGMSYAVASTATNTAVVSVLPRSRQGEGIGYFSMFLSLAMVVGPSLGLLLWKSENIYLLLSVVSILSAIAFLLVWRVQLPKTEKTVIPDKKKLKWSDIIEIKALPISLVSFFLFFSYSSLSGFLASYTNEIHQSSATGLFFIVYALMIVLFRPVVAKLFDSFNEHYLFYPSIIVFTIGMFLLSQAHSVMTILIAGILMGLSYGILFPCFQGLAIKQSPAVRSGAATATFFLLNDLGYGLGSYFMGFTASISSYRMMYVFAAVISLVTVVIYFFLHHIPEKKNQSVPTKI
ncbi:MFS transporter [Rummeliibacillus sp. JY-2-4R]